MANPNPHRARRAKRSARAPGTLRALQQKLWGAILWAETVLEEADTPDLRLRAIHALAQAAGHYGKLLEVGELEARLQAVEAQLPPSTRRRRG
jgi:hypothetical protein